MASGIVIEAESFLKGFANLGLEAMAAEQIHGIAGDIIERAKTLVHSDTGETRESLAIQGEGMDARGPYVDVGSTLPKAFYEEFGTIHGPAVAFLRTAIAEAMGGSGGFGVSWSGMHRPSASRSKATIARRAARAASKL